MVSDRRSAGEWARAAAVVARNVLFGGNIASLALAARPRELVGYSSECLFLYGALRRSRGLVERNVFEVVGGQAGTEITLAGFDGRTWFGPVTSYVVDIVSLCLLCRLVDPKVVFEIGTLDGYTALHFALNSRSETRIFTLDLPRDSQPPALRTTVVDDQHIRDSRGLDRYRFDGQRVASKISCLFGDSASFDVSPYERQADLFFIDGAHSYEYVRSDTMHAVRCCRPGSVIAWHDFGRFGVNGVTRWLREFRAMGNDVYAVPGGSLAFMVVA